MENPEIKLLYFDDEIENLSAFKASFRKHYQIFIVTSPEEAIEVLASQQISVLLIDQKMPQVTGMEFLKIINEEFPYLIKIMVTGYIEHNKEILNVALEKGDIFKYILKPWSFGEMKTAIEDAYNIHLYLKEKNKTFEKIKDQVSNNIKAPIANLEGLIGLAQVEMNDKVALTDYLHYMNVSLETLKARLEELLKSKNKGYESE